MLDNEHHVAPVADVVPVGGRRFRAHGRGADAGQILVIEVPDPDEVRNVATGVLADDKLAPTMRPPKEGIRQLSAGKRIAAA